MDTFTFSVIFMLQVAYILLHTLALSSQFRSDVTTKVLNEKYATVYNSFSS